MPVDQAPQDVAAGFERLIGKYDEPLQRRFGAVLAVDEKPDADPEEPGPLQEIVKLLSTRTDEGQKQFRAERRILLPNGARLAATTGRGGAPAHFFGGRT